MFARVIRIQAVALAALLTFQGCAGEEPAGPSGDDLDEDVVVVDRSSAELTLAKGRTYEYERTSSGAPGIDTTTAPTLERRPAVLNGNVSTLDLKQWGPLDMILGACGYEGRFVSGWGGFPDPPANCRTITSPYLTGGSEYSPAQRALLFACAGHWALTVAEGSPVYLSKVEYGAAGFTFQAYSANTKPKIGEDLKTFLGPSRSSNTEQVVFTLRPPSPSDASTWALMSADFFREAAILASRTLDPAQCDPTSLNTSVTGIRGDSRVIMDIVAATLTDALTGLTESAEKAQSLAAASGAAKYSTSADAQTAALRAWRDRHDSRLEGASIFVPVSEQTFEQRQAVAVWEMVNPDVGSANGYQDAYYYTTVPEQPEPGYSPNRAFAWIYPDSPVPPGLTALGSWRKAGVPLTTDEVASSASFPDLTGATKFRVEGYIDPNNQDGILYNLHRAGAGTAADPYRYRYVKASETGPSGWSPTADGARFVPAPFEINHTSDWRFPVVTSSLESLGAKRAEAFIRDMRIDPRLTGARTTATVATDMLYAMQGKYKSLYDNVTSGLTLLDKLGIELADVARACARIREVQATLGLVIVDDPANPGAPPNLAATPKIYGKPKLVFGTRRPSAPTHPGIIYARTGGRFSFPLYAKPDYVALGTFSSLPVGPAYARSSVLSTLDYVRYLLTNPSGVYDTAAGRYDGRYTTSTHEMLKSVLAWEQRYLGPRVRLTTTTTATTPADQVESLTLLIGGLGYATAATAKAEINIWAGEAGLECALTGQVGGLNCDAAAYRFLQTSAWTIGSASDTDVGKRGAVVVPVLKTESSQGAPSARLISINVPLFVTRTVGGKASLITAFYPARSAAAATAGSATLWLAPYGDYLAQVLGDALAADPNTPEQTAMSCAGVPTSVKVKLEDELTEAVEGKDGIESSFAHYLRKAREAALRADDLGDQMVQQGLSMDMRSEEARDALEDLCGGVINVGRLETAACAGAYNCDVVKLLENSASISDPQLQGDAEGLKRCLGIGDAPVNAILGDADACVWTATHNGRTYPTCVWPTGIDGKPLGASQGITAPPCLYIQGDKACPQPLPVSTSGGTVNLTYSATTKLNMSVTEAGLGASADPTATPRFMCGNLLKLRAFYDSKGFLVNGDRFSLNPNWENFDWVKQDRLLDIAQAMGFDLDEYYFPTVTAGGAPFISVGSSTGGPATPITTLPNHAQWNAWPCAPHALLNPALTGHDAAAASYCASSTGMKRSLLCGGFCGSSSTSAAQEQSRAHTQAHTLRKRLRNAVSVLKGVSGASFSNYMDTKEEGGKGLAFGGDTVSAGLLPAWHPYAPNQDVTRTRDRSKLCWMTGTNDERSCLTRTALTDTPGLRAPGTDWYGGYPKDPIFTYFRGCDYRLDDLQVEPAACGDMVEMLNGENGTVRLQLRGCGTPIPDYVCMYDGKTCGDALRYLYKIDEWKNFAKAKFPQQVTDFLRCRDSGVAGPDISYETRHLWEAVNDPSGCTVPQLNYIVAASTISTARIVVASSCDEAALKKGTVGSAPDYTTVLDGLDLACAAKSRQQIGCETLLDKSYVPSDAADFPTMSEMARCAADRVEGNLEQMLLPGIPKSIAEDIGANSVVQSFPENRGAFGQTVALLAGEIITMRQHVSSVVQAIRDLSLGLRRSQAELTALGLERDIKDVELYIQDLNSQKVDKNFEVSMVRSRQAISSQITSCLSAMATASGDWFSTGTGRAAGAMIGATAVCGNTIAQVAMESKIQDLTADIKEIDKTSIEYTKKAIELGQQVTDQQKQIVLIDASAKLNESMDRINTALIALLASHTQVQSYLVRLDSERNQASRLAAKVLMLENDQLGRQYAVNSAMRARMNTLRVRYERARTDAVASSYLARRAVEQKLGVDLSLMTDDMTGVPAPRTWVDKLCTMSGINYSEIRTGGMSDPSTGKQGPTAAPIDDVIPAEYDYADGYVGDFVTLLENFVEAYRIDYPFQDGDSLAVISLKDELLGVRRTNGECPAVQGPNLLYYTNGLSAAESGSNSAWEYPCAVTGTNLTGTELTFGAPAGSAGKSPFICSTLAGTSIQTCARPDARAFGLSLSASACAPLGDENPSTLDPAEGLAYRFTGSSCGMATAGLCNDLTGQGSLVTALPGGFVSVTTAANGVSGRPALLATNGQAVGIETSAPATDQYTVTVIAALSSPVNDQQYLLWDSPTTSGSERGEIYLALHYLSGSMRVRVGHYMNNRDANGNVLPGNPVYVATGALADPDGPWVISLRTNATTNVSEIWANGQKVAALTGTFRLHPSTLDAQRAVGVDAGSTSQLRVAEIQAHGRALTGLEISELHRGLGATYAVPILGGNVAVSTVPEMRQHVVLDPGSYLLSWYQYVGGFGTLAASSARVAISDGDLPIAFVPAASAGGLSMAQTSNEDRSLNEGWARYFGTFEVQDPSLITVAFRLPASTTNATFAGLQLENIDAYSSFAPAPYFPTGASLLADRSSCEDVDGSKFRGGKYWNYGCEYYCPPGTGLDCAADGDPSGLPKSCFYETKFPISLEAIEKGELLPEAGFARGNFNYRFSELAVNVVGTGVKNCDLSETPSSCYANNNVVYSIRHDEPFRVRNFDGDVFDSQLYPGNIQQAQALLAERYITNPVSSADRNLLADYWRGELSGRPIDGNFRLRIYEDEGLDWSAVEDVQVALRYRYWTRER